MAKLALCIGINDDPGTDMDLHRCVHDAHDWAAEPGRRGDRVDLLVNAQAAQQAMHAAMTRVFADAAAGDTVAITLPGHGSCVCSTDPGSAFTHAALKALRGLPPGATYDARSRATTPEHLAVTA